MKQPRSSWAVVVTVVLAPVAAGTAQPLQADGERWRCEVVAAPERTQTSYGLRAAVESEATPTLCDGICVVDVAFSYYPEAISGETGCVGRVNGECVWSHRMARNVSELRRYLEGALRLVTGTYRASGVDVEFRLARLEALRGLNARPPGADLWYAVDPRARSFSSSRLGERGAVARLVNPDPIGNPDWTSSGLDGAITLAGDLTYPDRMHSGYPYNVHVQSDWTRPRFGDTATTGWPFVLAHEFGHNLGLGHNFDARGDDFVKSGWRGGYGFRNEYPALVFYDPSCQGCEPETERYGTIMAYWAGQIFARFSDASATAYGRPMGGATANAVEVLRRNVPHLAARYTTSQLKPPTDYGCEPETCLGGGRFHVAVGFTAPHSFDPTSSVNTYPASRLPGAFGSNAALYYFFDPDNPEMLLKVLNGCAINGHWWVYGSAATDLPYKISISDLAEYGDVRWVSSDDIADPIVYEHVGGVIVGSNGYSGLGVIADSQALPCR